MPRSIQEILDHTDDLAARFEEHHPQPGDAKDATALRHLHDAMLRRAGAEREIADAVRAARDAGISWSAIGVALGTSGEAARQRYARLVTQRQAG